MDAGGHRAERQLRRVAAQDRHQGVLSMPNEQRAYWVGADRWALGAKAKPSRVWAMGGGSRTPEQEPATPMRLVQGKTAWLLDEGHDWKWHRGVGVKLSGGPRSHNTWIVCEYTTKGAADECR